MKKLLPSMLFMVTLIALSATCIDDPATDVSNTECTLEDTAFEDIYMEGGPPPALPEGQMWEMMGTQMATLRETQTLVRESLLNKDIPLLFSRELGRFCLF